MNELIVREISNELNVKIHQIENTLKLLMDGNTIPFIARYRKEATSNLDEEQIRKISEVYEYSVSLLKKKEDTIRLIEEKGLMTNELKDQILSANKLIEVEDLYRPFKEKKKTKATEAIANGLEPLAKHILTFPSVLDVSNYINDKIKNEEDAIQGAKYIIAEYISDDASYRKWIRNYTYNNGIIVTKLKKNAVDDDKVYDMYYDYTESINKIKPHRVLAINRAENQDVVSVSISIDNDYICSYLEAKVIKNHTGICKDYVIDAIKDGYKRLIEKSIEREIRSELKDSAEVIAIDNFSKNLEKLLLQPPMKDKVVLGLDPAFRTGCKLAVVDNTGKSIDISVIYPHEPHNKFEESKAKLLELIDKYNVDVIAIGNGTASRESEAFVAEVIKDKKNVSYIIVNEAGASVYSASKLAISEFPDLSVEQRSAISIARRLQDPLSELVKIDSKSIGVGLYQHDVNQTKLNESLEFVVTKSVNSVGVNINTASSSLLSYVSGLTKKVIDGIISYRDKYGKITSREELRKIKEFKDKQYEQSIGFIRIFDCKNILDKTGIHPESYSVVLDLLSRFDLSLSDIGNSTVFKDIDLSLYSKELNIDIYTLEDIVKTLLQPLRDPRDDFDKPLLRSDILKLSDLKKGMKLQGTVRNVVDFGVFVDIGLKNDGLVHISKLAKGYVSHPLDVVSVGDIVDCYVDDINDEKKKVSLSMVE